MDKKKKDQKLSLENDIYFLFVSIFSPCTPPAFEGTKQWAFRQVFAVTLINTSLNAISVSRCIFVLQLIRALCVYTYNPCRCTPEARRETAHTWKAHLNDYIWISSLRKKVPFPPGTQLDVMYGEEVHDDHSISDCPSTSTLWVDRSIRNSSRDAACRYMSQPLQTSPPEVFSTVLQGRWWMF